jgi:hypothetical protein
MMSLTLIDRTLLDSILDPTGEEVVEFFKREGVEVREVLNSNTSASVSSTAKQGKQFTDLINPFWVDEKEDWQQIRDLVLSAYRSGRREFQVEISLPFTPLQAPKTPAATQSSQRGGGSKTKKKKGRSATAQQLIVLPDQVEVEERTGDFSYVLTKKWYCSLKSCRNEKNLCYTIEGKNRDLAQHHYPIDTQNAKIWVKAIADAEVEAGEGEKAAEQPPASIFLRVCSKNGVKEKDNNKREEARQVPPGQSYMPHHQQPPFYPPPQYVYLQNSFPP